MATLFPSKTEQQDNTKEYILVVDDEPLIVDVLCNRLQLEGFNSLGVHSGPEAQAALEDSLSSSARPVDLVVLDRAMPEMNGLEVCHWIKEHPQLGHIPVLMLTAMATDDDKITGLDTGADDYVTKPYYAGELLARIHALLRSSNVEKELFRRNQQLAALNRIVTAVTARIQVDEILSSTLHGIRELLQAEAGSILLLDKTGRYLLQEKLINRDQELPAQRQIPLGEGLVGHAAQKQIPLLINNAQKDSRFCAQYDSLEEIKTRSVLIAPLIVQEKLTGVIRAINKEDTPFTQGDLDLLRSMAASVAIALENARLFHDLHTAYAQVESNQQRLQTTASTLQALFDGITDGLYIIDRDWQLVAVNQGRASQVSAEPAELVSRICYQGLYGRKSACANCPVEQTLDKGEGAHWVERKRSKSGLFTEWELSSYPIFDREGAVSQSIIFRREVTEQRRLEASLAQAEKLAAVGQLAAGVAHEINNPLTAIIANAQFLKEDLSPTDDSYQSAELIARAGERAARVVRRLLDFARQEEVKRQMVDINASLCESLILLSHQLSSAQIQVVTQLEPQLPPINANADHIQSIWLNLLVNAKDALSNQPGVRRIEALSCQQGDQVEVRIIDNGPGVPEEQLPYLFHPFYTTKSPGKGTGLGLFTSYRTVEQHGGQIDVVSEPGQGTMVTVRLPIHS